MMYKKCNHCYRPLRPYPAYVGESYETARSYRSSRGYKRNIASYSPKGYKAYHADFGCHRFTLDPIPAHRFIEHFKEKTPRRLLNGLELLNSILIRQQNNEWIYEIINSDLFSSLLTEKISVIETEEWDECWFDSVNNYCNCLKCKLQETVNQIKNNVNGFGYSTVTSGIEVGCIVEIVTGAFKGEKARVTSVSETKEEVSMELYEQPIPRTLKMRGDHVRVLERVESVRSPNSEIFELNEETEDEEEPVEEAEEETDSKSLAKTNLSNEIIDIYNNMPPDKKEKFLDALKKLQEQMGEDSDSID